MAPLMTKNILRSVAVVSSLALGSLAIEACNNNPAKDKPQAAVAEPVAVAPAAATAGSSKYTFSNSDSKIAFVGAKVTRKHEGNFGTFNGAIDLVNGKPEMSTVKVDVEMASLVADDPKLTGHLKTPDLFDVAKFPQAHFVSTSIKQGGEKGASHTVTGNLELHGVTKSITFPATIKVNGDAVDVDAEFVLNRKDFGVVYPGMPDDLIKDELLLKLQVHAKKSAA